MSYTSGYSRPRRQKGERLLRYNRKDAPGYRYTGFEVFMRGLRLTHENDEQIIRASRQRWAYRGVM